MYPAQEMERALLTAAKNGDLIRVEELLKQGCPVNTELHQVKCTGTYTNSVTVKQRTFL